MSRRVFGASIATCVVALGMLGASAAGASAAPVWNVESQAFPTAFQSSDTSDSAQNLLINATGGSFTLTFEGQTTHPLTDNAGVSPAEVQSALDELSTIGGAGGSVTVTLLFNRIPEREESEVLIEFAGTFAGQSVPLMTASSSSLSGGSHTAAVSYSTNDAYNIQVENLGSTASSGTITVEDHLPRGITTTQTPKGENEILNEWACSEGAGQTVVICHATKPASPATAAYDVLNPSVNGGAVEQIVIPVTASPGVAETVANSVTVSGGGASIAASSDNTNPVNLGASAAFGTSFLNFHAIEADGSPSKQAGGHPYAVTTDFDFNQELDPKLPSGFTGAPLRIGQPGNTNEVKSYADAAAGDEPKTIVAEVPLGLVGDPQATPTCTIAQFDSFGSGSDNENQNNCPADTRVGVTFFTVLDEQELGGPNQLFNLVPETGHAAEFGFDTALGLPIVLFGDVVHSARGYVLRVTARLPENGVGALSLTFFGDPAKAFSAAFSAEEAATAKETAFLTNPMDCAASEEARTLQLHIDDYAQPGIGEPFKADFADPNWVPSNAMLPPVEDCDALKFEPSLSLQPASGAEGGTTQADEPSGYGVNLEVPQNEEYSKLATPELKTAKVTLPAGLSVSPSAANGLAACSNEQIALESNEPGSCPLESELGTVKVTTPLLGEALEGQVFLGAPECGVGGVCTEADASEGKTFRLFIEVQSEKLGVTIKLPGSVRANPSTGQLTAEFAENPQLPFSDLELKFKDGSRAPLANPQTCGTFTTVSDLEPWSAPETATATSESSFATTGCGASLAFSPGLVAGMASPAAGASSSFSASFVRSDSEQDLGQIVLTTPPGLLGRIAGVTKCGEAEANAGTCPASSQIGTSSVSAGPGSDPYTIGGGKVYLTGPYQGEPFGLAIVVPAEAGPFKLAGNTGTGLEVVQASIAVNPATAALTVTSGALPQIVDGVPLRLRTVDVEINRAGFMRNATSCASESIAARITGEHPLGSSEAAKSSSVSTPYAASGCASLPFKPALTATSNGKTSKKSGASLTVQIAYPSEGQANVRRVHVQLPAKLPARQSTLEHACPEGSFDANPASCPPLSVVGSAKAITPLLNVPLEGPAYYVSHGGAAFPEIVAVLQGEGVTIDLHGENYISPKGIITSTFASVPDAPISSFTLSLPQGEDSLLAANNGNVCKGTLSMPTVIDAQNGAVIEQNTKIKVTGCPAKTAKPTLTITRAKLKNGKLVVTVKTSAKGRLRISGSALKTTTKKRVKAGKHQIKVKLTKAGRKGKARRKKVKLRAALSVGKQKVSKTTSVKL